MKRIKDWLHNILEKLSRRHQETRVNVFFSRRDDQSQNTERRSNACISFCLIECAVAILERVIGKKADGTADSEFLLVKRPAKGLLAGMWEFPTVELEQLQADHSLDGPSTYRQRSSSSLKYMTDILGLGWLQDNKDIERYDLGNAQHLFSHIRKVYHAEWVLVKSHDTAALRDKEAKPKKGAPETVWLSAEELATAAIPTGILKAYQLLEKYRKSKDSGLLDSSKAAKRKSTSATDSSSGLKKTKKEAGEGSISKFFVKKSLNRF